MKTFEPYKEVKEVNPEARAVAKELVEEGRKAGPKRETLIFVNNRLKGNALGQVLPDGLFETGTFCPSGNGN